MAEFDLAAALLNLPNVSNPDTQPGRDQIEYIHIDRISSNASNFYRITDQDIDALANNILLAGLQQPLRVHRAPDNEDRVVIVSGHRRFTAIKKLVLEGHADLAEVPCIVETADEPAALTELKLILANSDTRKIISADLDRQQVRLEDLLNELRSLGYEFPGRTRDYVAKLCNTSASRLARLKVIREKLAVPLLREKYEKGKLNESLAYKIAQQPEDFQRICSIAVSNNRCFFYSSVDPLKETCKMLSRLECPEGGTCRHSAKMMSHTAKTDDYARKCKACCVNCDYLADCKDSCPSAARNREKLLLKREAAEQKRLAERREKNLPFQKMAETVYGRIRSQVEAEALDLDVLLAVTEPYSVEKIRSRMEPGAEFDADEYTHSGLGTSVGTLVDIIRAADMLHCSIDYLLGRTSCPELPSGGNDLPAWRTGKPEHDGMYAARVDYGSGRLHYETLKYKDGVWIDGYAPLPEDLSPAFWVALPPEEDINGN